MGGSFGSFVGPVVAGALYIRSQASAFWLAAVLSTACVPFVFLLQQTPVVTSSSGTDDQLPLDLQSGLLDTEGDAAAPELAMHDADVDLPTQKDMVRLMHTVSFSLPQIALAVPERYTSWGHTHEMDTPSEKVRVLRSRTEG